MPARRGPAMVDPRTLARLLHWALFLAMALVVTLTEIMPRHIGAGTWPGPQLILVFAMVWVLRRPDYLPVWMIAGVGLTTDLILMRPPGLWAALMVIATEFLRSRSSNAREWPLALECAIATALMVLMMLCNRAVLGLFLVPQAGLGLDIQQLISSAIAYPFAVALSVYVLRLRYRLSSAIHTT